MASGLAVISRQWSGSESGGTGQAVSPAMLSGSRLLARMRSFGQARSSDSARRAQAATTCSQLSRMSSRFRSRRKLRERAGQRTVGFLAQIESGGDRFGDERGIIDGGELHEPHAVGISVEHVGGDLQRKARLARATHAGEREQARAGEQALHLGHLALAADEAA